VSIRSPRLLAPSLVLSLALGLVACGDATTTAPAAGDDGTVAGAPATSADRTDDPGAGTAAPEAPATARDAATPDPTGPVGPVTLAFDGREVPVASACAGADGAVLATTEGEVTIMLVREQGLAMRLVAEGHAAETDAVSVEGGTDATTYRADLAAVDVPEVTVAMMTMDDVAAALDAC
jgi:hypothetical protein